jgi:hypothetical protein
MAPAAVQAEVWVAVQSLIAEYWRRVDGLGDGPVEALFAEHGWMQYGPLRCEGREQIGRFYTGRARREAEAGSTTRHLFSNLLIEPLAAGRVRAVSTVCVMAGKGPLPLPSEPPAAVADFEDVLVETEPGVWRIEGRRASVVFTGDPAR